MADVSLWRWDLIAAALRLHGPALILSSGCSPYVLTGIFRVSGFLLPPKKHAFRWTGYVKANVWVHSALGWTWLPCRLYSHLENSVPKSSGLAFCFSELKSVGKQHRAGGFWQSALVRGLQIMQIHWSKSKPLVDSCSRIRTFQHMKNSLGCVYT